MPRFLVHGNSMEPTLEWGQRVLVSRTAYRIRKPKRGDLAVVRDRRHPEHLLVKRVAALPGDEVRLKAGVLEVNDLVVAVSGISSSDARWNLNDRAYFVVGDRLDGSADSRTFGPVDLSLIVGKVWLSYWPPHRWGLPRRSCVPR